MHEDNLQSRKFLSNLILNQLEGLKFISHAINLEQPTLNKDFTYLLTVLHITNNPLSKEWKPGATMGARLIMGSFGAHAHLFSNSCSPNDPITERAPILAPGFNSFWRWWATERTKTLGQTLENSKEYLLRHWLTDKHHKKSLFYFI